MKIILRIVLALVLLVVVSVAGLFALYESNRIVIADIDRARIVDSRVAPGLDPYLGQQRDSPGVGHRGQDQDPRPRPERRLRARCRWCTRRRWNRIRWPRSTRSSGSTA